MTVPILGLPPAVVPVNGLDAGGGVSGSGNVPVGPAKGVAEGAIIVGLALGPPLTVLAPWPYIAN